MRCRLGLTARTDRWVYPFSSGRGVRVKWKCDASVVRSEPDGPGGWVNPYAVKMSASATRRVACGRSSLKALFIACQSPRSTRYRVPSGLRIPGTRYLVLGILYLV